MDFYFRLAGVLAALLACGTAQASTGELYGYGSRASALGNTMLGGTSDSFATFYNPAANSTHPGLTMNFGVNFAHPSFTDINNVTISNPAVGNTLVTQTGTVDNSSYNDHLGQMVGGNVNFGEKFKSLTAGVMAFLPITHIAYIDSGDPFLPEYLSYRSRTQRPQIYGSLSANPISHLYLGMGLAISTNLSATTNAYFTTSPTAISHQQFATNIKPGASPYFGLYADPDPIRVGIVTRLPTRYKMDINMQANASILGQLNGIPLNIDASSSIYYDPLEEDVGLGWQINPVVFITAELDWLQYKAFEAPIITVTDLGSGAAIRPSINTTPPLQNIFVPKIGAQFTASEQLTIRMGYWYRPSPITDNSGPGNLVDPARHSVTAGIGLDLKKAKLTEKDIFLDIDAQFHYLVHQHINKNPGNELGNAGSMVGAPGYDIGGVLYGGGFSLGMNF